MFQSEVNVSQVPARMGALVMTLDKATSAHVLKDSEGRTAKVFHSKCFTF